MLPAATTKRAKRTRCYLGPPSAGAVRPKDLCSSFAGREQPSARACSRTTCAGPLLVARFRRPIGDLAITKLLSRLDAAATRAVRRCQNPRDTPRSTAARVAAPRRGRCRIVAMGHANDMGGRSTPASCCASSHEPTRGRTPLGPDFGDIASGLVTTAVTRRFATARCPRRDPGPRRAILCRPPLPRSFATVSLAAREAPHRFLQAR